MKETSTWLTADIFQEIFEEKYGKHFKIKTFTVEQIKDPWDPTPTYRVNILIEFKVKTSSSIFGCGNKKTHEEGISYLVRMCSEREIEMYDKLIPALVKIYTDKGKRVEFAQKFRKVYHNKVLVFEDPKTVCLRKSRHFDENDIRKILERLADFHAASAVYAESNNIDHLEIKVDKHKEILEVFSNKIRPTIIEKCEQGQYFADKFFGEEVKDTFDPKDFNVLNFGQCWPNNILFGSTDEIYFTDFQLPKFGSPALDLYYFLLSATTTNDKTKKFDYYIKCYYDCLVNNLELLGYKKEIPYLTDLRISLIQHGVWARIALCGVVCISSSEGNGDIYKNSKYVEVLRELLPWMDNRGLLEHKDPPMELVSKKDIDVAITQIEIIEKEAEVIAEEIVEVKEIVDPRIPRWITSEYFDEIVKHEMGGFTKITKFQPKAGTTPGENYASVLLRINIEAELEGVANSQKELSYILKTCHSEDMVSARDMDALGLFEREKEMYNHVIPMLEKLYDDKNVKVRFGPKSFNLAKNPGVDHLVLEDLKVESFKNADRLQGLDTAHVESVLKRLAQLHAASAVAFETIKPFSECLTVGFYDKRNREMFVEFSRGMQSLLKETLKTSYENGEYYSEKLIRDIYEQTDEMFDFFKVKPEEFNVLNHGDCWSNNIMFKYNERNELEDTVFVDFQLSKYGSPVADLYYFLLSSAAVDIKIKKFDHFIKYYHEHLVANLELLGYPKAIPSLCDLHIMLVKSPVIARNVVCSVMGAVLLDPTENANIDNFVNSDEAGIQFKRMMFTNPRFKRALTDLLPWMDNKGLLG